MCLCFLAKHNQKQIFLKKKHWENFSFDNHSRKKQLSSCYWVRIPPGAGLLIFFIFLTLSFSPSLYLALLISLNRSICLCSFPLSFPLLMSFFLFLRLLYTVQSQHSQFFETWKLRKLAGLEPQKMSDLKEIKSKQSQVIFFLIQYILFWIDWGQILFSPKLFSFQGLRRWALCTWGESEGTEKVGSVYLGWRWRDWVGGLSVSGVKVKGLSRWALCTWSEGEGTEKVGSLCLEWGWRDWVGGLSVPGVKVKGLRRWAPCVPGVRVGDEIIPVHVGSWSPPNLPYSTDQCNLLLRQDFWCVYTLWPKINFGNWKGHVLTH